jgi:peptidoglycan/xylan/chitin deacetylase (PgdA/CDA1 family)
MLFGESRGVVAPVFHAILPSGLKTPDVDPSYAVSREQLGQVVEYFHRQGFTPIGIPQLQQGLDPGRNYVMFTFDDGYANNLTAVDMLEAAGVPALFSINTGNTRSGDSFWWDVLYRELTATGSSPGQIDRERSRLIEIEPAAIRQELIARFGEGAFRARGNHDRPMNVAELRTLASRPLMSIGNHTIDHGLLAGRDRDRLSATLRHAQQDMQELIGATPIAIAYPFGRYDDVTIACCRSLAIQVGLTGEFGKARVPADVRDDGRLLRLPRCVIYADRPIDDQCENTHMDWKPSWMIRRYLRQWRKTPSAPPSAMP